MISLRQRVIRQLPAYHSGELSERAKAWVELQLAQDPRLRVESDAVQRVVAMLQANDPASPPDPSVVRALLPRLHHELEQALATPVAAPRFRLVPAAGVALLLFAVGTLAGAKLFPRTIVQERERIVTREVKVPVPTPQVVTVPVEKVVEKVVEKPVERVVTKWRTRTIYRDRVVYRTASQPLTARSKPSVEVVNVAPPASSAPAVASTNRATPRPAAVEF